MVLAKPWPPRTGYVTDALDELLMGRLVTLVHPDPMADGMALGALTNARIARFEQLCRTALVYPPTSSQLCTAPYCPTDPAPMDLRHDGFRWPICPSCSDHCRSSRCHQAARWARCSSRTRKAREPIGRAATARNARRRAAPVA